MTDDALAERRRPFRVAMLTDAEFRSEFQTSTQGMLPGVGASGLVPALVTIHIADYRPKRFGAVYHLLNFDDFGDSDRRQHYLRMLGEGQAIDKRTVVLAIMASEIWRSTEMFKPDGSQRYAAPEDDPNRSEGIAVFAMSLDVRSAYASCTVTRTPDGRFATFGDLDVAYSFDPAPDASDMDPVLLRHFWRGYANAYMDFNQT